MTTLLIGKQDGNGAKSSRETCRILRLRRPHHGRIPHSKFGVHGGGILQSLTTGRQFDGGVHRIHTRSEHTEHYSLLTSTNMKCVLVAQARIAASSLCARKESVIWSAMSSPCWSLPHLLSSRPPQHEAQPGQHDLLQDNPVHQAPLPKTIRSTSSAKEPLSHVRNTSSTSEERHANPGR